MITHLAIHTPRAEYRDEVLASMKRVDAAAAGQPGLIAIHAWTEIRGGRLVGISTWESMEAFQAAMPVIFAAVENDPFDVWEADDPEVMMLEAD